MVRVSTNNNYPESSNVPRTTQQDASVQIFHKHSGISVQLHCQRSHHCEYPNPMLSIQIKCCEEGWLKVLVRGEVFNNDKELSLVMNMVGPPGGFCSSAL